MIAIYTTSHINGKMRHGLVVVVVIVLVGGGGGVGLGISLFDIKQRNPPTYLVTLPSKNRSSCKIFKCGSLTLNKMPEQNPYTGWESHSRSQTVAYEVFLASMLSTYRKI